MVSALDEPDVQIPIAELLEIVLEQGASDLILTAGHEVMMTVAGVLQPMPGSGVLTPADARRLRRSAQGKGGEALKGGRPQRVGENAPSDDIKTAVLGHRSIAPLSWRLSWRPIWTARGRFDIRLIAAGAPSHPQRDPEFSRWRRPRGRGVVLVH